mmetsp:Transcript_34194/g.72808  ORF Transcript_34194/g.72808 Transcript_34194/m.72808 type:complete len:214 (-) Transcript_34194:420-1061(-)
MGLGLITGTKKVRSAQLRSVLPQKSLGRASPPPDRRLAPLPLGLGHQPQLHGMCQPMLCLQGEPMVTGPRLAGSCERQGAVHASSLLVARWHWRTCAGVLSPIGPGRSERHLFITHQSIDQPSLGWAPMYSHADADACVARIHRIVCIVCIVYLAELAAEIFPCEPPLARTVGSVFLSMRPVLEHVATVSLSSREVLEGGPANLGFGPPSQKK